MIYTIHSFDKKKREAEKKIQKHLEEIAKHLQEAKKIADKNGLDFYLNTGCYGMGGTYYSKKERPTDIELDEGWRMSNQGC